MDESVLTVMAILILVALLKLHVAGHEPRDLAAFYAVLILILSLYVGRSFKDAATETLAGFALLWLCFAALDWLTDMALKPFYWTVLIPGVAGFVGARLYLDFKV